MFNFKKEHLILTVILLTFIIGICLLLYSRQASQEIIFASQDNELSLSNNHLFTPDSQQDSAKKKEPEIIFIHIAGEVENPGVYQLPAGARAVEALQIAGGETRLADLDSLNLAVMLQDGQKIYIPSIIETEGQYWNDKQGNNTNLLEGHSSEADRVNINTASQEELQNLKGIGPGKAASIIKYREKYGRFTQAEELLEVNGIGPRTLEQIKEEIVF